jgi:hypothetical protein
MINHKPESYHQADINRLESGFEFILNIGIFDYVAHTCIRDNDIIFYYYNLTKEWCHENKQEKIRKAD